MASLYRFACDARLIPEYEDEKKHEVTESGEADLLSGKSALIVLTHFGSIPVVYMRQGLTFAELSWLAS